MPFDLETTTSKDIPHLTMDELAEAVRTYTERILDPDCLAGLRVKLRQRRDLAETIYIKRLFGVAGIKS
jgi:hypothetical protein